MSNTTNKPNTFVTIFLTVAATLAVISLLWVLPRTSYIVIGPILILGFVIASVLVTDFILKSMGLDIEEVYDYHTMYTLTR